MSSSVAGGDQKLELRPGFWSRRRRLFQAVGCGSWILMAVFLVWSLIEPHLLVVTRVTIRKPDLPRELNGLRIVHLSDLHYGPLVSRRMMRAVVAKSNALDPDLVVITGDFIYRDRKYIAPLFDILKDLKSRSGIYTIYGNHDYWSDVPLLRKRVQKAGMTDLEGRVQEVPARGVSFKIAGMGPVGVAFREFKDKLAAVRDDDFLVLLLHDPDFLEEFRPEQVDLALCGHTHGGQITFFGWFAFWLPTKSGERYRSGVVENGPMTVVISRGIGTIWFPLRFFAPPQIVEIKLEREEEKK